MRFTFCLLSFVFGVASVAQAIDKNASPTGTGRVGSAGGPNADTNSCIPSTQVFSIEDKDSSFRQISFTKGVVTVQSEKNEKFQVLCGAGSATGEGEGMDGVEASGSKPGFLDTKFARAKLNAAPGTKFAFYNTKETPIESIVNWYDADDATELDKRIDRLELNYRPWNGKRVLVQCSRDPEIASKVAIVDGNGDISSFYEFNPNQKNGAKKKCDPQYHTLNIGKGKITSSTRPVAFPDPGEWLVQELNPKEGTR